MDNKVLLRALMWSFVAFIVWQMISFQIWGPRPRTTDDQASGPTEVDNKVAVDQPESPGPTTPTREDRPPSFTKTTDSSFKARRAENIETFRIGSADQGEKSPYRMALELSSMEAALVSATLSDFANSPKKQDRYQLLGGSADSAESTARSMVIEQLTIDDSKVVDLRNVVWTGQVTKNKDAESVTFSTDVLSDQGTDAFELNVTYALAAQSAADRRYDLEMSISVTNRDDTPHRVIVGIRGPAGLQQIDLRVDDRAVMVASMSEGTVTQVSTPFYKQAGQPAYLFGGNGDNSRHWWAASANKFFTCAMTPLSADGSEGPEYIASIEAVDLDGVKETEDDVTFRMVTKSEEIQPGQGIVYPISCYLGPLDREGFSLEANQDYVQRQYLLMITRSYSMCTFGWLTEFMIVLMNAIFRVPPHNYGVAIIVLVLIVRVLLHPLTKKGQVNMLKMQKQMGKLSPKMDEIKKKFANDRVRMNQEVQKLYQTEQINPAGQMLTCLPMFLQMPIWIALWTSLNNNIGMRHEPFCLWIRDLTAPDQLWQFGGAFNIPLLGSMIGPITSLNILPILWAVSMYAQQKLMPKPTPPPGQSSAQADQAAQMQKMMPIMSVMFALVLYNAPSGLTLYILASTVFGTLEQIRIRQHIKELEAAGGVENKLAKKSKGPSGPLWLRRIKGHFGDKLREAQRQADQAQKLQGRK